ncbi:MAG: GntR family transcriptional regulator [Candidatus Izemoplasmatales bacterium]|uniref:GntR family transcriptional regulator n=1 Tax=Hujiaoplasma nucleasis TaxID=2725268 RepID=A0A7L6N6C8_9MOLU|nr:GntR family transcriptional regulator [Hujiaoplasma nucleasis]QLY40817.1 GntR family transcriptional regulator [Hujiaoplasma nucleasis]
MRMLNKQAKEPYYLQISKAIETMILSGYFSHGQKLPTLLEMKDLFNVSLKVAAQAYDDLNKKGYIYSRRGKGYFVSFYEKVKIDLNHLYEIEAELVYEHQMSRDIILFEKVQVEGYVQEQLNLNSGEYCYHIKQVFGKNNRNVLLQDIYLPFNHFPKLNKVYDDFPTIPSLIMNGYRYNLNEFSNRFYSGQASIEHEIFLRLQNNDPLWRIETICYTDDDQPIALVNQYMSGEYVTMAVMLNVS